MCFVGEGGDVKIDVSPMLLRRQMTLVASWTFSNIIQAECATFCVERKIDVDALFTHRWKLDQAERGVQAVRPAVGRQGRVPDVMDATTPPRKAERSRARGPTTMRDDSL